MDYKITAPNQSYNGESAGVYFINGVGIAKDGKSVDWFKEKGYTVEAIEEKGKKKGKQEEKDDNKEAGEANDGSGNSPEKAEA